jgi:hypothetical protein
MPFQSSDALDDQMLLDGSTGFSTGVVSATRPDAIPATSMESAINMDYDDFGNLVTRLGSISLTGNSESRNWEEILSTWNTTTSNYGSNLPTNAEVYSGFYFDTAASERLVIAVSDRNANTKNLYFGSPGVSYNAISGATLNNGATFVYFAQLNDKLFYSDGFGTLKYVSSANLNSSIAAGKISRIDVINQGSGHSSIPTITISAPPSGVTATVEARIGGDGAVLSIVILNPGSGYITAPTVSISPANQSHAVAFVSLTPPNKPLYLTTHTNRLWAVSGDTTIQPDTLYFSDILDGESWDPLGSIRVGGDGDPIRGLYSWFGYKLLVFKERSIWSVDADPTQDPADWTISLISGNIGCSSHRSIAAVGADVFFLSRDGIRSMAQIQAGTQTSVGLALSSPINDLISKIDKTKLDLCDGVFWNNRYLLAVPFVINEANGLGLESEFGVLLESDSLLELEAAFPRNNAVIVYHSLARSWLGYWDNWQVNDFFATSFSTFGPVLMFAGDMTSISEGAGQVWSFNDFLPNTRLAPVASSAYLDGGSRYQSSVITKAYNLNEPIPDKIGYSVQFAFDNPYTSSNTDAAIAYSTDMSGTFTDLDSSLTITNSQKFLKAYNLISKGRWNTIQFRVQTNPNSGGRLSLQSTILSGFVDSVRPQQ